MGAGFSIRARADSAAEILIYEDVGESWFGGVTAKEFAGELKALGDVATIDLRINSAGGDVFDGLAIYRQLVEHKAKVTTHIDGLAASIASVIAMAGEEIRISEAGFVMVHDAWGVSIGNATDMRKMADLLDTTSGSIRDVYAARTSVDDGEIRRLMADETWMTAAEAVEKGFADTVAENLRLAASASIDLARHRFRKTPASLAARPDFHQARSRLNLMRAQIESGRRKEISAG